MAERSNAAVLKTVEPKGSGGSNPSLSATSLARGLLLFFLCVSANAQPSAPDTPAGRTLSAMLAALDSGDRTVVSDYIARYGHGESADDVLRSVQQVGRLDLAEIVTSEPLRVQFIVRSAAAGFRALGMLEVENADPARVTFSAPWTPVPPKAVVVGFKVDASARQRVIASVAEKLRDRYVLPEPAVQLERIDERFVVNLPRGRAVNPITGTNWEGVGVQPDVAVAAGDALPTATGLAAKAIPR